MAPRSILKIHSVLSAHATSLYIAVFLAGISAVIGAAMLFVWLSSDYKPRHSVWYSVSAMLASGEGFVNIYPPEESDLGRFLRFETMAITPEQVVKSGVAGPPDSYQRAHWGLFHVLGAVWWLIGISWNAIKIFQVVLLSVTTLLLYGLFRLGMNRILSAAGVLLFISTPLVLSNLPVPRDFVKAPLILGSILVMGKLISRASSSQRYFGLSVLLGSIAGLGLGFRQDLLLCLIPSACVLAICPLNMPGFAVRRRLTAIVVMLSAWMITAAPFLMVMADDTAQTAHSIVGGLASDRSLGIPPGSYELIHACNDAELSATYCSHANRVKGDSPSLLLLDYSIETAETERMARQFLVEAFKTLPADFLNRAYASTMYILVGARWNDWTVPVAASGAMTALSQVQLAVTWHWEQFRLYYGGLALLFLCCSNLRTVYFVLFLVLYFCGTASLQFEQRHVFHLCFLPLWVMGFVLDKALLAAKRILFDFTVPSRHDLSRTRPVLFRSICFTLGAGFIILCPLYGLRLYQYWTLGSLLPRYTNAVLEPIATEAKPSTRPDFVSFCATLWPEPDYSVLEREGWTKAVERGERYLRTEYLAAEFEAGAAPIDVGIEYGVSGGPLASGGVPGDYDLSAMTQVSVVDANGPMLVKYFFPVYETADPPNNGHGSNRFTGFSMSQTAAKSFKGLYRVRNIKDFKLLPTLILPSNLSCFQRYRLLPSLSEYTKWRSVARPRALAEKAEVLREKGDLAGAQAAYREAIEWAPAYYESYEGLSNLFIGEDDLMGLTREWGTAVEAHPERHLAWFCLGLARERKDDLDGAIEAYEQSLKLSPEAAGTAEALARALRAKGEAYELRGETTKAQEWFSRAAAIRSAPPSGAATK